MNKTKTNIAVKSNAGIRRKIDIIVGDNGQYPSGDVLDANATKQLVDNVADRVGAIMDMAPENFDTFKEVADAITSKANAADLATVATTGSYNDLTSKPTIPNVAVVNLEVEDLDVSTTPYTITNQNKISQICDLIETKTIVMGTISFDANYPIPSLTFYTFASTYDGTDLIHVDLVASYFYFEYLSSIGTVMPGATADVTSRYVTSNTEP